jgi:hypothetical protein
MQFRPIYEKFSHFLRRILPPFPLDDPSSSSSMAPSEFVPHRFSFFEGTVRIRCAEEMRKKTSGILLTVLHGGIIRGERRG